MGSPDQPIELPPGVKLLRTLEGHMSAVTSLAFDPQGRTLASGGFDKIVRLWEPHTGKPLRTLKGHSGSVEALACSPDGVLLASKSGDHTVRLWRCDTWEPVAVIPEPTEPLNQLTPLAFHPTEPLLATGGSAPGTFALSRGMLIHLWALDLDVLLGSSKVISYQERNESVARDAESEREHVKTPAAAVVPQKKHGVFICYRRDDSEDVTGRIWDRLTPVLGREVIFRDVDAIPIGVDFRDYIREALSHCRIFLAIIGREWLDVRDQGVRRRLESARDHVRIEIETALARPDLKVVPVFVRNARLPEPEQLPSTMEKLAFLNGHKVRGDPDFNHDMDALISYLRSVLDNS